MKKMIIDILMDIKMNHQFEKNYLKKKLKVFEKNFNCNRSK